MDAETEIKRMISMKNNEKIAMLTAYDNCFAGIEDGLGIDLILVGDSLGMVILGYDTTTKVTMQDVMHHIKAVASGAKNTVIVGDMPHRSYETDEIAVRNAEALLSAGAHAVKIEGNKPGIVKAIRRKGIHVMGHIGLTPQTITDFKVQGRDEASAKKLVDEAKELEHAGCFSLVLECIPTGPSKIISESINIPTIGIGCGKYCDGQVLVVNDMLGMFDKFKPKFVKRYAEIGRIAKEAISRYVKDVKKERFPDEEHSYK